MLVILAEIVEIELDVLRNNILRFELLLSISAFTVTLGALVTGKERGDCDRPNNKIPCDWSARARGQHRCTPG